MRRGGGAHRSPHRPGVRRPGRHSTVDTTRPPTHQRLQSRRQSTPRCDPLTDGDAVALTVSRVLCVFLSMRPPLQLHTYLTRCLLYSPASVHARRRGGQEEAILRPPARLDAQAHAARLLELVELQLAAAIRAWVATQSAKRLSGKLCGREPSAFGAFGRQQGRGPLRGPMRAALCSEAPWGPEGRRAQVPRAQGASGGRCRRCQGDELLERAAGARSHEHRVPRDRLLE